MVDLAISIDGETIANPDAYWGEIHENEDGKAIVWWEYVTPPKAEGLHTFTVEFSYPDGYEDLTPEGVEGRDTDLAPGTTYSFTGHYEVVDEHDE